MNRRVIITENAPAPAAPLSQGIRKGPILQVSGQLPLDPDSGEVVGTTVAEQTTQTLRNLTAVLKAGGAVLEDLVMLRVYLTDPAHLAEMNGAYASAVGEPSPARTTVYMPLPEGILVEVDALAVLETDSAAAKPKPLRPRAQPAVHGVSARWGQDGFSPVEGLRQPAVPPTELLERCARFQAPDSIPYAAFTGTSSRGGITAAPRCFWWTKSPNRPRSAARGRVCEHRPGLPDRSLGVMTPTGFEDAHHPASSTSHSHAQADHVHSYPTIRREIRGIVGRRPRASDRAGRISAKSDETNWFNHGNSSRRFTAVGRETSSTFAMTR